MSLLYHAYVYLEFLILACTIYILAPKYGIHISGETFKTHDYRHTLASSFYDEGVSIQTIRDYLGHNNENMTKQYIDYMPKRIEQANKEYFNQAENLLATGIIPKKRGEKTGK